MKQTIKLKEEDISRMVMEAIEEINAKAPGRLARWAGVGPGFDGGNQRHMKAYDTIKDSIMYSMNNYKLRPDVIQGILSSIEEDLRNGQY